MDAAEIPGVSGTYRLNGQEKHGCSYQTKLAAAKAYDSLVMRHYGEFARLNPPELDDLGVIIVAKSAEKHGAFDFDKSPWQRNLRSLNVNRK